MNINSYVILVYEYLGMIMKEWRLGENSRLVFCNFCIFGGRNRFCRGVVGNVCLRRFLGRLRVFGMCPWLLLAAVSVCLLGWLLLISVTSFCDSTATLYSCIILPAYPDYSTPKTYNSFPHYNT